MPLRRLVGRLGVVLSIFAAACTGLGGLTGKESEDAGAVADGSTTTDAPSTSPDGDVGIIDGGSDSAGVSNLVANGGFEEGVGACGPGWRPDRTTLTKSNEKHTGASSCLVCLVSGNTAANVFTLNDSIATPKAGENYYAEAWVAAPPTGTTAPMNMQLTVDDVNLAFAGVIPQPNNWQKVQMQGSVAVDGTALGFALKLVPPDAGEGCYLVDDVLVIRQ